VFYTLLEEMVLFRTGNGSIPRFIYGTPKWFYIEPFFLAKGSIGQVWNPRVLYRTFSSKSAWLQIKQTEVRTAFYFIAVILLTVKTGLT